MAHADSPETPRAGASSDAVAKAGLAAPLIMSLFIASIFCLTFYRQSPPRAVAASAPPSEFSSGRAMRHLEVISRAPHPTGSVEHALVRDYILKELGALGLETEVQTSTVAKPVADNLVHAATVRNIVARARGTAPGKAVLLVAHYDSVPHSHGASDDGSGVVTLLETARALKSGAPVKNDVVFLFTDAEEAWLLGAAAFAEEHPLAKNVGVALNFEARGSGGAATMFETSDANGWLISEFAAAVPYPNASSLGYEIYKLLPNDTDLSVFKRSQLAGLNFAYLDGLPRYHTRADSIENIDERSLQHQGSYALALARRFGDANLADVREGNRVYFDILGFTILHYPASWVLPLSILTTILFVAVTLYGLKRERLKLSGIGIGFATFVGSLIFASVFISLLWWLTSTVQVRSGRSLQDDFYNNKLYLVAFAALVIAISTTLYNLVRRWVAAESLSMGALLMWTLIMWLVSIAIPGASYLLTWSLLFILISMFFIFLRGERRTDSALNFVVLSLCVVPAIVLFAPVIYQIFVALGLDVSGAVAALVALLFGLFIPCFTLLAASKKWLIPVVAGALGVVCLALALFTFDFDRQHPRASNIVFALNADTGKAAWASSDAALDEWTQQFFSNGATRGSFREYLPTATGTFFKSDAPALALPPPEVTLVSDSAADGVRTLAMRITAPKEYELFTAFIDQPAGVLAATVNGKRVEMPAPAAPGQPPASWSLQYWALPPEGIDLTLEVKAAPPLKLKVMGRFFKLPDIPGAQFKPRPDDTMPSPFRLSDATLVTKTFTF